MKKAAHYSTSDSRPSPVLYPLVLAALGFDATGLMLDVIVRAGSDNSQDIRDAIAATS